MPYSHNDQRRPPRRDRSHGLADERGGQRRGSTRNRGHGGSRKRPHRPQGGDPLHVNQYKSNHNYRSLTGRDAGYNLRRGGLGSTFSGGIAPRGIDRRKAIILGGAILVLVMLFIVISSCARSCSAQKAENEVKSQAEVNSYDSRVSPGVSEALSKKFTPVLDRDEKITWIAQNANKYTDERLPELALRESAAVTFVASVPNHDKTESGYGEGTEKGSYPQFYDWDERWGYLDYGPSNVGVNGSALTTMAMAYMGLTGKNDQSISNLAKLATDGKFVGNDGDTADEFFTTVAPTIGLATREYTASGENITIALEAKTPVAVHLNAGLTTPYAHWALVINANSDGSVTLYDPDSSAATTRTWAAGTIGAKTSKMYALSLASDATASEDGSTSASNSASTGTGTGTSAATGASTSTSTGASTSTNA